MAKIKTRALSLLMAAVLAFSLLPISAFAAQTEQQAKDEQAGYQISAAGGTNYYTSAGDLLTGSNATAAKADVIVSKTIAATGTENLFDVTTNVQYKGTTTTVTPRPAAVVLVIDISGSMKDNSGGSGGPGNSKLKKAQAAAVSFLDSFAKDGTALSSQKRMVSVVAFSRSAKTQDMDPWVQGTQYWLDVSQTGNLEKAEKVINDLSAGGGTNTEAGLVLANNLLTSSNTAITSALSGISTAQQSTILLTDGKPTYHIQDYSGEVYVEEHEVGAWSWGQWVKTRVEGQYVPVDTAAAADRSSIDQVPSEDYYSYSYSVAHKNQPKNTTKTLAEYKFIGGGGDSTTTDETYPVQTAAQTLMANSRKLYSIALDLSGTVPAYQTGHNGDSSYYDGSVSVATTSDSDGSVTGGWLMDSKYCGCTGVYSVSSGSATGLNDAFSSILSDSMQTGTGADQAVTDSMNVASTSGSTASTFSFVKFTGAAAEDSSNVTESAGQISWAFSNATADSTTAWGTDSSQNPVGHSYSLTYQVMLDNSVSGFESDHPYSLGAASFSYYNNTTTGTTNQTAVSQNPAAKGYLASLSFLKTAYETGSALGGAEFQLSNKVWNAFGGGEHFGGSTVEKPGDPDAVAVKAAGTVRVNAATDNVKVNPDGSANGNYGTLSFSSSNTQPNGIPSGYQYTLKEVTAPSEPYAGYDKIAEKDLSVSYGVVSGMRNGETVADRQLQAYHEIKITKEWRTPESVDDETITVSLYQDPAAGFDQSNPGSAAVYATLTLGKTLSACSSSGGHAVVKSVAVDGKKWTYTVEVEWNNPETGLVRSYAASEAAMGSFDAGYDTTGNDKLYISNTANGTRNFYVAKQWVLPTGTTAPETVSVNVLEGTKTAAQGTVQSDGTVKEFTGLSQYNSTYTGNAVYTAQETDLNTSLYRFVGATGTGSNAADPYTLVNTVVNEKTPVSGSKQWNASELGTKLPSTTVELYRTDASGKITGDPLAEITLDGKADNAADGVNAETAPYTFTFYTDSSNAVLEKYTFTSKTVTAADGKSQISIPTAVTLNGYAVVEKGVNDQNSITLNGSQFTVSTSGNTITNTLTGKVSVTVNKTWIDKEEDESHPTVTVTLLANNGSAVDVDGKTVTAQTLTNDTCTFPNLPEYDGNGKMIAYTVTESGTEGKYTCTENETKQDSTTGNWTVTLKNRQNIEDDKVSVTVNKTWNRPAEAAQAEATFTLYADGGRYTSDPTRTLTSSQTAASWTGLPKYRYDTETVDGVEKDVITKIDYTVDETSVPKGYTVSGGDENTGTNGNFVYSFTNTITGNVTVTVNKTWADAANAGNHTGVTFALTRTSLVDGVQTPDTEFANAHKTCAIDDATQSFSGTFDRYDENGRLYTYSVTENNVAGYSPEYDNSHAAAFVTGDYTFGIKNVLNMAYTTSTAQKIWVTSQSERPAITLILQQKDASGWHNYQVDGKDVTYEMPGTESTYTFGLAADGKTATLPLYNAERTVTYEYRVREVPVPGYEAPAYSDASNSTVITNTQLQSTKGLTVSKTWLDPVNTAHPNVTLTLTATVNGSTPVSSVTVGKSAVTFPKTIVLGYQSGADTTPSGTGNTATSDNWEYTFTNLPVYDNNRKVISYQITEESVPGYDQLESNSAFTLVNRIQQETVTVTGTKTWSNRVTGSGNVNVTNDVSSIEVGLYSGSESNLGTPIATQTVSVSDMAASTAFTFQKDAAGKDLPKYDDNGRTIRYFVREGQWVTVDGAQVFQPIANGGTILYPDGTDNQAFDDTFEVTYTQGAAEYTNTAIDNAYQVPDRYYFQIVADYDTYLSATHTFSAKNILVASGELEGAAGLNKVIDTASGTYGHDKYVSYNGVTFQYKGTLENSAASVTLSQKNHLYTIHLTYERQLYTLTTVYEFEGMQTPPAGFETTTTPQVSTPDAQGNYSDPGKYLSGADYSTSAVPAGASVPEGYTLSAVPANAAGKFTDQNITVTYVYVKHVVDVPGADVPASFTIVKTNGTENVTDRSAVFGLYSAAGCAETALVKTYPTVNGTVSVTAGSAAGQIDVGTYYLKEIKAPDGYTAGSTVWTVTISYKTVQDSSATSGGFNRHKEYSVSVTSGTASALTDGVLTVANTRNTGSLTISKVYGTASDYRNADAAYTFTIKGIAGAVSGTAGKTYSTSQTDAENNPVSVTFDAVSNQTTVTLKAGESVTLNALPSGSYTVAENSALVDGYTLGTVYSLDGGVTAMTENAVSVDSAAPAVLTVTNTYTKQFHDVNNAAKFEIHKTDSDGKALNGAEFTLYDSYTPASGETAAQFGTVVAVSAQKTDDQGAAIAGSLVITIPAEQLTDTTKTFHLVETKAPSGYQADGTVWEVKVTKPANSDTSNVTVSPEVNSDKLFDRIFNWVVSLTDDSWSDGILTVENSKRTGTRDVAASLTVNKVDADTGTALDTAVFTLYSDAGCSSKIGDFSTTGGTATISGLTDGPYYLKETSAPANYEASDTVWQITTTSSRASESLENGVFVTPIHYSVSSVKEYKDGAATGDELFVNRALRVENTYQTGNLTVTKAITGVYVRGTYTFRIQAGSMENGVWTTDTAFHGTYSIQGSSQTVEFVNGTAQYTFNGAGSITLKDLPVGSYCVGEIDTAGDLDYEREVSGSGVAVVHYQPETPDAITITNHYSKPDVSKKGTGVLTVFKNVSVSDELAAGKTYTFAISGNDKWGDPLDESLRTLTVEANRSVAVTLPYGTYTVTEVTADDPATTKDETVAAIADYEWTGVTYGTEAGKYTASAGQSITLSDTSRAAAVYALNTYTRDTGSLTISKVYGTRNQNASADRTYTFTIAGPADASGEYTAAPGTAGVTFDAQTHTASVTLKAGESCTISGLPTGNYTVAEADAAVSGYTLRTDYSLAGGVAAVTRGADTALTVTNTYTAESDDDDDDRPGPGTPTNPTDPGTDIPDPGVPGTDKPTTPVTPGEPTVNIDDPQVPQSDKPTANKVVKPSKTGDNLELWVLAAGVSGLGLIWMALTDRKRRKEEQ